MNKQDLLYHPLPSWMDGNGPDGDIVLASRIRLARNLEQAPFPAQATPVQLAEVVQVMEDVLPAIQEASGEAYHFCDLREWSGVERAVLMEKHLISPQLAEQGAGRALLLNDATTISVMVNEEDHLRIQSMQAGLQLAAALTAAGQMDDAIEAAAPFAFDEHWGYLTACPTNVGTGLRASVMLHLPALVLTRQVPRVVNAVTQLGLTVRGLYGEGSEAAGNIFQISNQLTLGYSEEEIVENLTGVVKQVVEHERNARQRLLKQRANHLADRVWRAYGILAYARSMNGQEALAQLSEVRLGIDCGLIEGVSPSVFNELIVATRPYFLQHRAGEEALTREARDMCRASYIRERIKQEG